MTVLMFLSFLSFFLYLQLGLFVLANKVESKINRTFFYLCCCLVVWSFGSIFLHGSPSTEAVRFWDRFSSFGWIFFPTYLVFFFLELQKGRRTFIENLIRLVFFLSATLFFIKSLTGNLLTTGYYRHQGIWTSQVNTGKLWYWLFLIYLILCFAYSIFTLLRWSVKVNTIKERRQSQIILITLILFFAGIFISHYLLPILKLANTTGLIHLLSFIWVSGFGYAIVKYKFIVLNPELAANSIISKMNEVLFFIDNDGNVLRINQFTEDILGYQAEDLLNRPFKDLVVDYPNYDEIDWKLDSIDKEKLKNQECCLRLRTGDIIPFNLSSATVLDEVGDSLGTIIVGFDVRYQKLLEREIELRKKAEESLKESEDKAKRLYLMMRLMCDNVPDMIWAKDLNGRFIFVNKATSDKLLFTQTKDEPIGKTEEFFIEREKKSHPDDMQWYTFGDLSTDSDAITICNRESGRFIEFGYIHNAFLYLDVHKAPFWDDTGRLIGIVGCGRDITYEKRIEEEHRSVHRSLLAEKELLKTTLKSIGDGVISTDRNERIVLMNNVAEQITGFSKDDVWSQQISSIFNLITPSTNETVLLPVAETIKTGKISHLSFKEGTGELPVLINRNGARISISATIAPIKSSDGVIIGTVIVFRDQTDLLRMEEELNKSQRLESVSLLAGGIAHDFNNILTAIIGNITMTMLSLENQPELNHRLHDAERACFRARDLIQQLLTLSKGVVFIKKDIKLEKVIKEIALFSVRGSQLNCHFNLSQDLSAVEVDESQFCQVISNLVINAKQAMPEGGVIKISAHNIKIDKDCKIPLQPGKYVQISVKDSGEGIPEENLNKIFDPFFTTKKQGSGLGLSSSFNIIKKHKGYLTVKSQLGIGSVFSIYLPASEAIPPDEESLEESLCFKDQGSVLIMDDDQEVVNTLKMMLQTIGYRVTTSSNGEEAIAEYEIAQKMGNEFSFVILDLTIRGGMGGRETIVKLRASNPDLKAILSSGTYLDEDVRGLIKDDFNQIMEKPYTFKKLVQTIKMLLDR